MASPDIQKDIAAEVKLILGEFSDYVKHNVVTFIMRICPLVEAQEIYLTIVNRAKREEKVPEGEVFNMLQRVTQTSLQRWKSVIHERMKLLRQSEKDFGNPISSRYPWKEDCIQSSWKYLWDTDIAQQLHAMNVHTEKRVKKLDKIVFRTNDENPEQDQPGPSRGRPEPSSPVVQRLEDGQWVTYLPETIQVKQEDLKIIDPTDLFFQDVMKEDSSGAAVEHLERTMQMITGKAPKDKPEPQKAKKTSEGSTPEDSGAESLKSEESGAKVKTRGGFKHGKTRATSHASTSSATVTSGAIVTTGKRTGRSPETSPKVKGNASKKPK